MTGSEGRSISVGKSVILMEGRRSVWSWGGGSSVVGDVIEGSSVFVVDVSEGWEGLFKRTWTFARRFWGREEM